MTKHQFLVVVTLLALGGTVAAKQGIRVEQPPPSGREIAQSAVNFGERWRPAGTNAATRVIGTVIDIRQVPVPGAAIQLRNLDTGNVEQTKESDQEGSYEFEVEESGTYIVEMVMVDGFIVALSNAGSLTRFETLQTVIQLPGRWDMSSRQMVIPQSTTSFFGMSAETSMTGATLNSAIDRSIPTTDAGVPVSPS